MNTIIKKLLPVALLLLLGGCTHHYGRYSGRPYYRDNSYNFGAYFYNNHQHDRYIHDWKRHSPRSSEHYYGSDHMYREKKHYGRHYKGKHKYFDHKRDRSNYHKHDSDRQYDRHKRKMPLFINPFFGRF